MTYPGNTAPSGAPQWRVWSLRRAGNAFRWSSLPDRPVGGDGPIAALVGLLVLLEFVFVMPTVGLVRLTIHNARSPGWYLEARYVTSDGRSAESQVELQVPTKRQANGCGACCNENSVMVRTSTRQPSGSHRTLPHDVPPHGSAADQRDVLR